MPAGNTRRCGPCNNRKKSPRSVKSAVARPGRGVNERGKSSRIALNKPPRALFLLAFNFSRDYTRANSAQGKKMEAKPRTLHRLEKIVAVCALLAVLAL